MAEGQYYAVVGFLSMKEKKSNRRKRYRRLDFAKELVFSQNFQEVEGNVFSTRQLRRFQSNWARDGLIN